MFINQCVKFIFRNKINKLFEDRLTFWDLENERYEKKSLALYIFRKTKNQENFSRLVVNANIFLWNVFPLHTHLEGKPFTNRQHNNREQRVGLELLKKLIDMLIPSHIVAIGNDATSVANRIVETIHIPVHSLRHSSYGGVVKFKVQVFEIYGDYRRY